MLVVAPLSGHHSTLLRETVRQLLVDHKVYITDWTDARMVPVEAGPFHLDDYVTYVQDFIRHIGPEVNVMSVCQPTVPVLGAISLLATNGEFTPRTMTMMGGPIDARKSPTAVNNLAMNKSYEWFENNVIYRVPTSFPGAGRRVYPGFMQHTGFVAMNPDRHLTSHYDYFLDLGGFTRPELVELVRGLPCRRVVLDGETLALRPDITRQVGRIATRLEDGHDANVTFICTHNSRRSHMSQMRRYVLASKRFTNFLP